MGKCSAGIKLFNVRLERSLHSRTIAGLGAVTYEKRDTKDGRPGWSE